MDLHTLFGLSVKTFLDILAYQIVHLLPINLHNRTLCHFVGIFRVSCSPPGVSTESIDFTFPCNPEGFSQRPTARENLINTVGQIPAVFSILNDPGILSIGFPAGAFTQIYPKQLDQELSRVFYLVLVVGGSSTTQIDQK